MRILALSDIHEAYDRAKQIVRSEAHIDLVLLVGDLTTHGTPERATEAITDLAPLAPRILAVAGNMDSREIDALYLEKGIGLNGIGMMIGDVGLFGVSGCPTSPLHTPFELSEIEIRNLAECGWKDVGGARIKVFVPHAPPFGTKLDRISSGLHVGSKEVAWFVQEHQPDLLICGHIHESYGEDSLGVTRLVNCGSVRDGRYVVVEIGDAIRITARTL
jgi:uncharacterized protein